MADGDENGMRLRNRQLRNAVPPVPQRNLPAVQDTPSTIFGTIRRKLSYWLSPFGARTSTPAAEMTIEEPEIIPQRAQDDEWFDVETQPRHIREETPVVNHFHNCTFAADEERNTIRRHRPKLPPFDNTNLEAYLANFEAVTSGWSQDEKLELLREKLEGRAARVLASLDLQEGPVTYEHLITALEQHFVGERSEWMARLRCITREPMESLDDLAFRIRLYSRRAYGRLQDDLGLQLYLTLREGPLGDRLYEYKDKDLDEVLRRAKSYESHLLATNQPVSTRPETTVGAIDNRGFQPSGLNGLLEANQRGRGNALRGNRGRGFGGRGRGHERYGNNDRRWTMEDRYCHVCFSNEHFWRDCPTAKQHFQRPADAAPPSDSSNPNLNQ